MMATGVARPRAQGQLMTSTLMPRASANVKVWPSSSQMTNVAAAIQMTVGTKMPRPCPRSWPWGLRRGGVAHQADDLGQRRVLADALGTAGQRTVLVDGRGADGEPGNLSTGMFSPVKAASLTVEMPSVTVPSTGCSHRGGLKEVADVDLTDRDCDLLAAAQDAGGLGASFIRLSVRRWFCPCCRLPAFADGDER